MEVSRVFFMTDLLLEDSVHNCLHPLKRIPGTIRDKN
jgi:hypothetical protein